MDTILKNLCTTMFPYSVPTVRIMVVESSYQKKDNIYYLISKKKRGNDNN